MNTTNRNIVGLILAASIASTIGDLPFNTLPLLLGSLAESFKLQAETVGYLGSVCFAGYFVGTLGAPFWMNRLNWRVLTVTAAIGTALAFIASAFAKNLESLYLAWAAIGFFASTMTCLGMRVLSDLPNQERSYGVRQGISLAITASVLFVLPPLVMAVWKYPGAAYTLAGVVALLALSAIWVPRHPPLVVAATNARIGLHSALPLLVFLLFLIGNIGLWAFLERVGAARGITSTETGIVFAVLKVLGGIAAFSVAIIGGRMGRWTPHVVALVGIGVGLVLLGTTSGFMAFAVGAWVWEFSFTCGCVFQTAAIARSDPGGRVVVLVPAVFAASSMLGPGLAGQLVHADSFTNVLAMALASSLIPVAYYALRMARAMECGAGFGVDGATVRSGTPR